MSAGTTYVLQNAALPGETITRFVPAGAQLSPYYERAGWNVVSADSSPLPARHTVDYVSADFPPGSPADGALWLQTRDGGAVPTWRGDFASGDTSAFAFAQGATVARDYARTGQNGVRLAPDAANSNYSCLTLNTTTHGYEQGHAWMSLRVIFRLIEKTDPANTFTNLFEIGNSEAGSPKGQFTVYIDAGSLVFDFNTEDTTVVDPDPTVGEWHEFEARVCFAGPKFTATVRYDGRLLPTVESASDMPAATCTTLWVGYPNKATDQTTDFDLVELLPADSDPGFIGQGAPILRERRSGAWA